MPFAVASQISSKYEEDTLGVPYHGCIIILIKYKYYTSVRHTHPRRFMHGCTALATVMDVVTKRNFHFVLILAFPVDKIGSVSLNEDCNSHEH